MSPTIVTKILWYFIDNLCRRVNGFEEIEPVYPKQKRELLAFICADKRYPLSPRASSHLGPCWRYSCTFPSEGFQQFVDSCSVLRHSAHLSNEMAQRGSCDGPLLSSSTAESSAAHSIRTEDLADPLTIVTPLSFVLAWGHEYAS